MLAKPKGLEAESLPECQENLVANALELVTQCSLLLRVLHRPMPCSKYEARPVWSPQPQLFFGIY